MSVEISHGEAQREEPPVLTADLFAPFPYYGNKRRAAPIIWSAIGDVPNYISGFGGALGELLARPSGHRPKIETANDASGQIANTWRAVVEQLRADPKFCDPELAGWWIWGAALWIGGGWCAPAGGREGDPSKQRKRPATGGQGGRPHIGRGVHAGSMKRPHLSGSGSARLGSGVHAEALVPKTGQGRHPRLRVREGTPAIGTGVHQTKLPHLAGPMNPVREDGTNTGVGYGRGIHSSEVREDILGFFRMLSARLRRVRIVCGDFERVLTPAVTVSHGLTGVFLDPPYGDDAKRCADLYACDGGDIAPRARRWALEHGEDPRYRIVLAGYEGEHDMPASWRCISWKSSGGSANADRERLWISPHCLGGARADGPLFDGRSA